MFYRQKEDIDPEQSFDAVDLDVLLRNVVNRCSIELRSAQSLDEARNLIADLLQAFRVTHRSIRLLVGQYEKEMELGSDALSLAREQIEKIFVLTLLLDDPKKWVEVYLKDSWKKKYQYFLLHKEEHQDLPRHQEFLTVHGPEEMERGRILHGVSADEKAAVEFKFFNPEPDKELPLNLKGKMIQDFPTPGVAKQKVKDPIKGVLNRWHIEYKLLCGYTHIGMDKLAAQALPTQRYGTPDSVKSAYFENVIQPSLIISLVATAFACTEVFRYVSQNAGIAGELTKLWNELEQKSLLGKLFWNMRAKSQLPILL